MVKLTEAEGRRVVSGAGRRRHGDMNQNTQNSSMNKF